MPEPLTRSAVRSYRTVSPLPQLLRADRRSVLCCTVRRVAAPGCYPACCPWEFGLSSAFAAILRATPLDNSNRVSANKNPS